MERRYKRVYVDAGVVSSYGKEFGNALLKALPEKSQPMWTEENLEAGSLHVLVYNPDFDLLKIREIVPVIDFDMPAKPKSVIIQ